MSYQPVARRRTASVLEPFGNVLEVVYDEHYLAVVGG
jgi:hypothetical protein